MTPRNSAAMSGMPVQSSIHQVTTAPKPTISAWAKFTMLVTP